MNFRLRQILLVPGVLCWLAAFWIFFGPHWLQLQLPSWCSATESDPAWKPFYRMAPLFLSTAWPGGLFLLAGIIFMALGSGPGCAVTEGLWFPVEKARLPRRTQKWTVMGLGAAGLCVILFRVVVEFGWDHAATFFWLGGIALGGFALYRRDLQDRIQPVSARELAGSALALLGLILIATLGSKESGRPMLLGLGAGFVLLGLVRKTWREGAWVAALFCGTMWTHAFDLESWRYASVGDEYSFFSTIEAIRSGSETHPYWSAMGVYGDHPMAASYWQSMACWLWGWNVTGWRLGEVFAVHVGAMLLYVFLRKGWGRSGALVATGFFLVGHHVLAMPKVGYTVTQGVIPLAGAWLALLLMRERRSLFWAYLAGVATGWAFFTYTLSVPLSGATGLLVVCLWTKGPEKGWETLRQFVVACLAFGLGWLLTCQTRWLVLDWWINAQERTMATAWQVRPVRLLDFVLSNLIYVAGMPFSFQQRTHYNMGPLLDPLAALAFCFGLAWTLRVGWKNWQGRWMAVSLLWAIVILAVTNRYDYPPNTRSFLLTLFYAPFVAAAFQWITGKNNLLLALGLVAVDAWLNVRLLYPLLDRTYERNPYHFYVRTLQNAAPGVTVYMLMEQPGGSDGNFLLVARAYGLPTDRIIFLSPDQPEKLRQALDDPKRGTIQLWLPRNFDAVHHPIVPLLNQRPPDRTEIWQDGLAITFGRCLEWKSSGPGQNAVLPTPHDQNHGL